MANSTNANSSFSHSGLRILQWNVCSIMSKFPEIAKRSADFDVLALSETWLQPRDICNLRGFDCVRQDRIGQGTKGGGVCLYVKRGIKYSRIPITFDGNGKIEACAVQIFTTDGPLGIVSIYCPPPLTGISGQDWAKFFGQFSPKSIYCGDFNVHHIEWGSKSCCKAGKIIKEFIDHSDLLILNKQKHTHFSSAYNSWDSIDISMVHASLGPTTEWSISEDSWGSDHFPIFILIKCYAISYNPYPRSNRIQSKNIDWKSFKSRINTAVFENKVSLNEILEPEVKYSSFTAIITDALSPIHKSQNNQPISSHRINDASYQPRFPPPCEWWDSECDRFLRLRKAAWLSFKSSKLRTDFIKYKKISAQARICFRNKKKEIFAEFCSNLRKYSNPSYVWKKVKAFKNRWEGSRNSHEFSGESLIAVNNLIDEISPPSVNSERPDFDYMGGDHFLDLPFSSDELEYAINSGKPNSAPGPDGIDYQAIRNLPDNAREILLGLYNTFYKNKTVPKEWNRYSMSFIPKKKILNFVPFLWHVACVK